MIPSGKQLNEKQRSALDQFRDAVKDCKIKETSDEYLTPWLIVHDFHVDRAEKMLRQSMEWRRTYDVDNLIKTYQKLEVVTKYFSFGEMGIDKFGYPIYVMGFGRTDLKGILQSVTKKDYMTYFAFEFERMFTVTIPNTSKQTGKKVSQILFIVDVDQFSMRELMHKPSIEIIFDFLKTFLNNHPDMCRKAIVINASKIFNVLFAMIKPLLHRNDAEKIFIYGTDKSEWMPALLNEIESDQLFSYYGGTQTDPDGNPKCLTKWNMGGKVPRSYYLSSKLPVPKDNMETSNILAGAGGRKKIKLIIDVPFSMIRWKFMTEGGDIGFRVYHKDPKGDVVDLIPLTRVESHLIMEEGEITCEKSGKHVVEFDNTFSFLKSKKLHYYITVDPPSAK